MKLLLLLHHPDDIENSETEQLNSAIEVRNTFVQYFSTVGAVSWRK